MWQTRRDCPTDNLHQPVIVYLLCSGSHSRFRLGMAWPMPVQRCTPVTYTSKSSGEETKIGRWREPWAHLSYDIRQVPLRHVVVHALGDLVGVSARRQVDKVADDGGPAGVGRGLGQESWSGAKRCGRSERGATRKVKEGHGGLCLVHSSPDVLRPGAAHRR